MQYSELGYAIFKCIDACTYDYIYIYIRSTIKSPCRQDLVQTETKQKQTIGNVQVNSGDYAMEAKAHKDPDINPAIGNVRNHPMNILPICLQFTAPGSKFIRATPTTPPRRHWVV